MKLHHRHGENMMYAIITIFLQDMRSTGVTDRTNNVLQTTKEFNQIQQKAFFICKDIATSTYTQWNIYV